MRYNIDMRKTFSENKLTRLKKVLSGGDSSVLTFAIGTPENPMKKNSTVRDNDQHRDEFEEILRRNYLQYIKVNGIYGNIEHSYFVLNPSLKWCKWVFGERFTQESFIFGENKNGEVTFSLYFHDSPEKPMKLVDTSPFYEPSRKSDYVTKFRDFRFNIPFSFFESGVSSTATQFDRFLEDASVSKHTYIESLSRLLSDNTKTLRSEFTLRHLLYHGIID